MSDCPDIDAESLLKGSRRNKRFSVKPNSAVLRLLIPIVSIHHGLLYACETNENSLGDGTHPTEPANSMVAEFVDEKMIDDMLTWIETHSQYDVEYTRENPPVIDFCRAGDIIDYEGGQIIVDTDLNAAYDSMQRRINIVGPWDPNSILSQSTLLHELVHDVQLHNRAWYCLQQPEWEAYKLQDEWLQEQGMTSGFDWLYVYFLARCPRDHHP